MPPAESQNVAPEAASSDRQSFYPPMMRVVTKGWFTTRERLVPLDELRREDEERARKTAGR